MKRAKKATGLTVCRARPRQPAASLTCLPTNLVSIVFACLSLRDHVSLSTAAPFLRATSLLRSSSPAHIRMLPRAVDRPGLIAFFGRFRPLALTWSTRGREPESPPLHELLIAHGMAPTSSRTAWRRPCFDSGIGW
jgi:hypothetical protein